MSPEESSRWTKDVKESRDQIIRELTSVERVIK